MGRRRPPRGRKIHRANPLWWEIREVYDQKVRHLSFLYPFFARKKPPVQNLREDTQGLNFSSCLDGIRKGYIICIFNICASRKSPGKACSGHFVAFKEFREVEPRAFSLEIRVKGKDYFFDYILLIAYAFHKLAYT